MRLLYLYHKNINFTLQIRNLLKIRFLIYLFLQDETIKV